MKKFIQKILVFLVPAIVYVIVASIFMPRILSLQKGPSIKQQITYSFENAIGREYELVILGNSKLYRGLNPDEFTLNTFNFSHTNDSYNQMYYKLNYILENGKKVKYLILGTDYFQFSFKSDTRNYVYVDFLEDKYIMDFTKKSPILLKMDYYLSNIPPKKLLSLKFKFTKPVLRANGQYVVNTKADENETRKRDINRLNFQVLYFKNILDLCKSRNIKVFIVMPHVLQNELNSYTDLEISEFDTFIKEHTDNSNVFYLNYSRAKSNLTLLDYADIAHLNESGADKFSRVLDQDILKLIRTEK